jgi:hypothetical protein
LDADAFLFGFRLLRPDGDSYQPLGRFDRGKTLVMFDRGDVDPTPSGWDN